MTEAHTRPHVDLTVIMCALNEFGRIQQAFGDFLDASRQRSEGCQIILIDNGSTDGTREYLSSLRKPGVEVVLNEQNIGKGGSIKKGIALSLGTYVAIHDPDLEYKGSDVWQLFDAARESRAGLVLGSRIMGGDATYRYRRNYLGVRALTALINILYGSRITDAATAMKLIEGELARRLVLRCSGFDLDFELVVRVRRLGYDIAERRIQYTPRTFKEGKKLRAFRDGALALRAILRDRLARASSFSAPAVDGRQSIR